MGNTIQEQAKLIAARVDGDAAGLGNTAVLDILREVLRTVIACYIGGLFGDGGTADPAVVSARFKEEYDDNPVKMKKRIARRIRAEATAMMSKAQANALADGVIEQALDPSVTEAVVSACCEGAGFVIERIVEAPALVVGEVLPAPAAAEAPPVTPEVAE